MFYREFSSNDVGRERSSAPKDKDQISGIGFEGGEGGGGGDSGQVPHARAPIVAA